MPKLIVPKSEEPKPPPRNWGKDPVSDFIDTAFKNIWATFAMPKGNFEYFVKVDGLYKEAISLLENSKRWFEGIFLLRAHSSYLGSLRLCFSGQVTETYLLLRACLENALYSFHISRDPDLQEVWLNRHEDEKSFRLMKNSFKFGPILTAYKQHDSSNGPIAETLYDLTIVMGAHPNPQGILTNLNLKETDKHREILSNYLNIPSPAWEAAEKNTARVAICTLLVFQSIYKERFEISGLSKKILASSRGL